MEINGATAEPLSNIALISDLRLLNKRCKSQTVWLEMTGFLYKCNVCFIVNDTSPDLAACYSHKIDINLPPLGHRCRLCRKTHGFFVRWPCTAAWSQSSLKVFGTETWHKSYSYSRSAGVVHQIYGLMIFKYLEMILNLITHVVETIQEHILTNVTSKNKSDSSHIKRHPATSVMFRGITRAGIPLWKPTTLMMHLRRKMLMR